MTLEVPELWTRRPGSFRRAHRIDVYEKATIVQRDLRSGSWVVGGIPSGSAAALDLEAGGGIIVYYRGEVLDSGRVTQVFELEAYDAEAGEYVSRVQAAGDLDLVFVEDRLAHPSPFDLNFAAADTKLYNGPGETVMKAVVNDNLGPLAHPSRVQPHFTIAADLARGDTVRDEVRLDPLGDLMVGWGTTAGLIPRCVASAGALVFDVYEPRDLTDSIVFGIGRATASRVSRTETAPELTWSWVGGQGEGTARQFVGGGNSASELRWGFRREALRDRRDTNDTAVLEQSRDEELATKNESMAVEVDPLEVENHQYLTDYRLGDLVSAVTASGLLVSRQVREVKVELGGDPAVKFSPLVGDPLIVPPGTMELFGQVRDLRSRLVTQEAR